MLKLYNRSHFLNNGGERNSNSIDMKDMVSKNYFPIMHTSIKSLKMDEIQESESSTLSHGKRKY